MNCTIIIDGSEISVKTGINLLWVALDHGIDIPNLCNVKDIPRPAASCRLCYVEIKGRPEPVTSCTETAHDGMVIVTDSVAIKRLRKFSFDLLLSHHQVNCSVCPVNGKCELQRIAHSQHFKILERRFNRMDPHIEEDKSHPQFNYNPNKCVLCGRCVYICTSKGSGVLDFAYHGINTRVSTFAGIPLAKTGCNTCLECVRVCPAGSFYLK